jgi:hypothetical protein
MGLLDSVFGSLPKLSGPGTVPDSSVSYVVAPEGTVINEAWDKVESTFGGAGPFSKLNESAPSFDQLGADAAFNKIDKQDPYFGAASAAKVPVSTVSAREIKSATGGTENRDNNDHIVKLVAKSNYGAISSIKRDGIGPFESYQSDEVLFTVMPDISESRTADYETLSPSQLPGEFHKYHGTKSTTWAINAVFTCRTRNEAQLNYLYLNTLRGWTMPYFGEKQAEQFPGKLGAPPPVLDFSGWRGLVGKVPVVLTSTQWNWPKDCDWLPTGIMDEAGQEIPFPTVMNVTLNIVESYSPEQFNGFDLQSFRNGRMINAWEPLNRGGAAPSVNEARGGNQGATNGTPEPAPDENVAEEAKFLRQQNSGTPSNEDAKFLRQQQSADLNDEQIGT